MVTSSSLERNRPNAGSNTSYQGRTSDRHHDPPNTQVCHLRNVPTSRTGRSHAGFTGQAIGINKGSSVQ